MESSVTSKGQMTLPKAAREHLKVRPGDRVKIFLHPNGTVVLMPKLPASSIKGMFAGRVKKPVPVEEMDEAIETSAATIAQNGYDPDDPVVALAIEVFGSSAKASAWLSTPDPRHSDQTPIVMLRTPEGRAAVEEMLIQVDEGIFI